MQRGLRILFLKWKVVSELFIYCVKVTQTFKICLQFNISKHSTQRIKGWG